MIGADERNERRSWAVIALCSIMMAAEIIGGLVFGSIALIADGCTCPPTRPPCCWPRSPYARRHAEDARFSFGTGKLGDLAGFSPARWCW